MRLIAQKSLPWVCTCQAPTSYVTMRDCGNIMMCACQSNHAVRDGRMKFGFLCMLRCGWNVSMMQPQQSSGYSNVIYHGSCCTADEVMDQDEMEDLLDDLGIDADY